MKIKVNSQQTNVVTVNTQSNNEVIAVGIQGPAGIQGVAGAAITTLDRIVDIDATTKTDGSVLVYKANTQKWTSTTTLDAQNMEGGEF